MWKSPLLTYCVGEPMPEQSLRRRPARPPGALLGSLAVATRRASDVFVECLEAEGVKHVFGIPGEETLDLNESLARSSIDFVPVRHEQGGAYMADVYGRLTGRAGVCLGTLGPGA